MSTTDRSIAKFSRRQLGYFTREQALHTGLSYRQIRHRVASGIWESPYGGVFRWAGAPLSPEGRVLAAVLALPGAVASHNSAANLWHWGKFPMSPIQVTRPHGQRHGLSGVRVHQTRSLPAHHCTKVGAVPVTSRARTAFDLAGTLSHEAVGSVVDVQIASRRLRLGQLATVFADLGRPGRPGTLTMAAILDRRLGGGAPNASELESRFEALCQRRGLPSGTAQFAAPWTSRDNPCPERVDRAHETERVIIELDGRTYHAQVRAFENDRRRDQLALAHGWATLRFTWLQVVNDPRHVEWVLRQVLALEC